MHKGLGSTGGHGAGRCDACGAEPWLWRAAEAGRRLIDNAAYYRQPGTGRGEMVVRMMADRDDRLFFSPIDHAFHDLRTAIAAVTPVPAD